MDQETIETLKHQLQEKAKEYYRRGKPEQGDKVWNAIDALEDWERQGFSGQPPVDLAEFGLEILSAEQMEAERGRRREQLRRDPLAAETQGAGAENEQPQRMKMLNDLRRTANSELISDLDKALRLARDLLASTVLDDASQQEVKKLETQARDRLSVLHSESSTIERLSALGHLEEAIATLEGFLNHGRFEFEDRYGNIISTSDKLRELNNEYASFCTQKTIQYIERAESFLPEYPKLALEVLGEAWRRFDRADSPVRERLEQCRNEVSELAVRWEAAQDLVSRATREPDPQTRLALMLEARSRYDGLPAIDALLLVAKRDAVNAVIYDTKSNCAKARLLLVSGKLDHAQQAVLEAREMAKPLWGPSEDLETELIKVDQLMDDIIRAAGQQRLVEDTSRTVDEYLQKHDHQSAELALALLPDELRTLPGIRLLEGRVDAARSGDRVFQVAQQRFDKGDFQGVIDILTIPDPSDRAAVQGKSSEMPSLDDRCLHLRQRAQARVYYGEGVVALEHDPAHARLCFDFAVDLDPQLRELTQARSLEIELDHQSAAKMHEQLQRTRDDLDPPAELLALAHVVRAVERYLAVVGAVEHSQTEAEDNLADG